MICGEARSALLASVQNDGEGRALEHLFVHTWTAAQGGAAPEAGVPRAAVLPCCDGSFRTERHDSNSYGSVVLRFVDLAAFEVRELHLGVSLYMGRHDHVGVKNWIAHRLARFDVLPPDMSSTTTDSGANVRKSLHLIVMMSW